MRRVLVFTACALMVSGGLIADEETPGGDQAEGTFTLSWWSIDGGGGVSSGVPFELDGVIGQVDAGVIYAENFLLLGGFLSGGNIGIVFVDGFEGGSSDRWSYTTGD